MYLIYVDESADEKLFVLTGLAIPAASWEVAFNQVRHFRSELHGSDGLNIHAEFHAWKFVSGRGDIADRVVTKGRRCDIFRETLRMTAALPGAKLIATVTPSGQEERAFGTLLRGIQRILESERAYAVLICDQGKDAFYTRVAHGLRTQNAIGNILEEPLFKNSAQSYLVQLSDFCGYALLRQEHPLASKTRYGLDKAFELLAPITRRV